MIVQFREKGPARLLDFFTSAFPDYGRHEKRTNISCTVDAFQANSAALTTEITTTQFDLSQEPAGPS